jgi:hypothetical protein
MTLRFAPATTDNPLIPNKTQSQNRCAPATILVKTRQNSSKSSSELVILSVSDGLLAQIRHPTALPMRRMFFLGYISYILKSQGIALRGTMRRRRCGRGRERHSRAAKKRPDAGASTWGRQVTAGEKPVTACTWPLAPHLRFVTGCGEVVHQSECAPRVPQW